MLTNSYIVKDKNKNLIVVYAGLAFLLLCAILLVLYLKEENNKVDMGKISIKDDKRFSKKATVVVKEISVPVYEDNARGGSYYIVYDDNTVNVVFLTDKKYNEITKKDFLKEKVQLVGRTTKIPVEVRKAITSVYNMGVSEKSDDFIDNDAFVKIFKDIYLDTTNPHSESAGLLMMFMFFFLILGVSSLILGLALNIIYMRPIKKMDEYEFTLIEVELDEKRLLHDEKTNLFLTEHFVVCLRRKFTGYKYDNILWMYVLQKNGKTSLNILTKDGKTTKLLNFGSNVSDEERKVYEQTWNTIASKTPGIVLGYSEQNEAHFKEMIKQMKNS